MQRTTDLEALPAFLTRPRMYALLVVAALLPGIAAIGGGFFLADDGTMILRSPYLRENPWPLSDMIMRPRFNHYGPLHELLIYLQRLAFGTDALGFRIVSLGLHALAAVFCFKLLERLSGRTMLSWVAALLWAAHPIHSESVAWMVEQKTLLAGVFAFASLAFYFDTGASQFKRVLPALALMILACFAKSPAIIVGPIILLYELFRLGPMKDTRARSRLFSIARVLPFLVVTAVFARLALWAHSKMDARVPWSIVDAMMNMPGALLIYIKTALLPWTCSFFQDMDRVSSFASAGFLTPLIVLVAIAAAMVLAANTDRRKWVIFCILAYVAAIGPMLNMSMWSFPAYDRFQYFALPFLFLGLGFAIEDGIARLKLAEKESKQALQAVAIAACAMIATFGMVRGKLFEDEINVVLDSVKKAPRNAYSHAALANTLGPNWNAAIKAGDAEQAARLAKTIGDAAETAQKCWNFHDFYHQPANLMRSAGETALTIGELDRAEKFLVLAATDAGWAIFDDEQRAAAVMLRNLLEIRIQQALSAVPPERTREALAAADRILKALPRGVFQPGDGEYARYMIENRYAELEKAAGNYWLHRLRSATAAAAKEAIPNGTAAYNKVKP
jgi:hypothetical protein